MSSLLVTNDFPPKIGGIQSYLYELWRRLPPASTTVLTTAYPGAWAWDTQQLFRVERADEGWLLPRRALAGRIDALAREVEAAIVFLDPMLPLGLIGSQLRSAPHVLVVHGAEVTVPGRLPASRQVARKVLRGAAGVVAAGHYVAGEAERAARQALPTLLIPPGVDTARFRPLDPGARAAARERFGFASERPLVVGVSRLVPRKGFDMLLDAVRGLDPDVQVAIAGDGRDRKRLEEHAAPLGARARLLGRVPDVDLPALYASADVFAMVCRDRWGGLEAEGFGIVFAEAAACGVPSVAGRSGGVHDAVVDGESGFIVDPKSITEIRGALERLLRDEGLRARLGRAARQRAETELSYDVLAARLAPLAAGDLDVLAR